MGAVSRAIQEGLHISENQALNECTWEKFESLSVDDEIWIFGIGECAELFLKRYEGQVNKKIQGVIDNDSSKQGKAVSEYINIHGYEELRCKNIESIKVLDGKDKSSTTVLIASTRYYEEIAQQLKDIGFNKIFPILVMEGKIYKDEETIELKSYAEECLKYSVEKRKIVIKAGPYGEHGIQISHKLQALSDELDIVWIVPGGICDVPDGIRKVNVSDKKQCIYELETAHIWIFGDTIPDYVIKRPDQIYIQTKHWASITLKKFYMDLDNYLRFPNIRNTYVHDSESMDIIFSGSDFDEESCRSGFAFKGQFIRVGSPRSDILFIDSVRDNIRKKYAIDEDSRVILYAPTFRARKKGHTSGKMKDVDINFEQIKNAFEKRFGGKWVFFLRIHPFVAAESRKVATSEYIIDVSSHPSSEELVAASDVTITDYSSICFEHAFVEKPVFLFASDETEYVGNERELLLDYHSLPFPISHTNGELESQIIDFDESSYRTCLRDFMTSYGVSEDGHASERAAEAIMNMIG